MIIMDYYLPLIEVSCSHTWQGQDSLSFKKLLKNIIITIISQQVTCGSRRKAVEDTVVPMCFCSSRKCFTFSQRKYKTYIFNWNAYVAYFSKYTTMDLPCRHTDRSSWSRARAGALPSEESSLQWERLTRRGRWRGSYWRKREPSSRKRSSG